jgi:hypothetical protein
VVGFVCECGCGREEVCLVDLFLQGRMWGAEGAVQRAVCRRRCLEDWYHLHFMGVVFTRRRGFYLGSTANGFGYGWSLWCGCRAVVHYKAWSLRLVHVIAEGPE